MINVDIMQDSSEIVHYDRPGIPLYIRLGCLSIYPEMRALGHWHQDMELIYMRSGEMNYSINGQTILLAPGDTLFVSPRQMHYGYHNNGQDCQYICVLCHPSLFSGNPCIQDTYIDQLGAGTPYLHFHGNSDIGAHMNSIWHVKETALPGYELDVLGHLQLILGQVFREAASAAPGRETDMELTLLRDMVAYIQQHYAGPLTLDRIAAAGKVGRSKCCQLFKTYIQESPMAFLLDYRLEVSSHLLKTTTSGISEIALSCGFNHLSYFSKQFARKFGCTPSAFRRGNPPLKISN